MDRFTFYTLAFFEKLNMYDNASLSRYTKVGLCACYKSSILESLTHKLEYQYKFYNPPARLLMGLWC